MLSINQNDSITVSTTNSSCTCGSPIIDAVKCNAYNSLSIFDSISKEGSGSENVVRRIDFTYSKV